MLGQRIHFYQLMFLVYAFNLVESLSSIKQNGQPQRILSRKRRYLIFPTGSSIQLVYDSTITVPDYTLYITTGITVALAWGLPDKPTYPESELVENYEHGALPLLQYRQDKNVTNSTHHGEINANNHTLNSYYQQNDFKTYLEKLYNYLQRNRKPDSYYFGQSSSSSSNHRPDKYCNDQHCAYNNKISYHMDDLQKNNYQSFNTRPPYSPIYYSNKNSKNYDAFTNYMMTNYFKPWIENDFYKTATTITTTTTSKPSKQTTSTEEYKPIINKLHTIFPAMGKRSIRNSTASYTEKFYLEHHRNTRHELYKIIEKYLFAKGYNGTACVLKTLCEVGERRHENEPGSFLTEIVRAIFSLPVAQLQHVVNKRHIEYDEAHQQSENCAEKFDDCPHSVWNAGFLIETDDILPNFKV